MRGNKWREEVVGSMWGRGDDGRYIYTSMGSDGVLLSIQGEGVAERLNLFFLEEEERNCIHQIRGVCGTKANLQETSRHIHAMIMCSIAI